MVIAETKLAMAARHVAEALLRGSVTLSPDRSKLVGTPLSEELLTHALV
jgi:hypothetical protein